MGVHAVAEVLSSCWVAVAFKAKKLGDLTLLVKSRIGFVVFKLASILLLHLFLLNFGHRLLTEIIVILKCSAALFASHSTG